MLADYPVGVFLATVDVDRARAFYEGALSLTFVADDGFALIFDANGTALRVSRVLDFAPQSFTVLGWTVPDLAATIDVLTAKGVVFERYDFMVQDERGIGTFPSGDKVAWFKDPDGNLLSLTQPV